VTPPLVFRHGPAEVAFTIAVAAWVLFEAVMRVRQRLRATDPPNDPSFFVVVLSGLGLYVRIRAEERQLTQALGDEYEHFAAGRNRLVPGVW
jgi:protein-S-isoprenylcysteine O-methyltransferase Ste14